MPWISFEKYNKAAPHSQNIKIRATQKPPQISRISKKNICEIREICGCCFIFGTENWPEPWTGDCVFGTDGMQGCREANNRFTICI